MKTLKNIISIPFTIIGLSVGIVWLFIALIMIDDSDLDNESNKYNRGEY